MLLGSTTPHRVIKVFPKQGVKQKAKAAFKAAFKAASSKAQGTESHTLLKGDSYSIEPICMMYLKSKVARMIDPEPLRELQLGDEGGIQINLIMVDE